MSPKHPAELAPAVGRAVRILDLLAAAGPVPMSLADIARSLEAAKSSILNICGVLEADRLIQRRDAGYVLGHRTVELGGAYLESFDQVREFYRITASDPVLAKELLQLVILDRTDVIYLARHEGSAPLRVSAAVGDRFPASVTAVGNALLAQLDPAEVAQRYTEPGTLPKRTDQSVTTLAQLQTKLADVRQLGYALDNGETFPNVVGVAAYLPAIRSGGAPMAMGASLIFAPGERVQKRIDAVTKALLAAAAQMSNPMSESALGAA